MIDIFMSVPPKQFRDMNAKNIFEFIKYAYDSVNDSNVILQLNESIYSALQD